MSKPVTISLPFTNNDDLPVAKWYHGSRLRNRALAIAISFFGFICMLVLIRRIAYGSSDSVALGNSYYSTHPSSHLTYEGGDILAGGLTHLIIVAGHAIWRGGNSYSLDEDWVLVPIQLGQTNVFVEHIKKAADLAATDSKSLVVFSGGESRPLAAGRTESQSYAALLELLIARSEVRLQQMTRVTTEQFARDSYENLLFSIARFYEVTGRYPSRISVVGYTFKRDRYVNIHRKAVKFPDTQFEYFGIDPPGLDLAAASEGERTEARLLFEKDPYGCHDKALVDKKKSRNPARRRHGYEISNPLLAPLIDFCPEDDQLYSGRLPWS